MGFENEFASYEPLRRLLDSPKVKSLQDRLLVRTTNDPREQEEFIKKIIKKANFPSDFIPDYIIAIDGSFQPAKAENGFLGAEFGYITISAVLIIEKVVRELAKQEFIDPKKFRERKRHLLLIQ